MKPKIEILKDDAALARRVADLILQQAFAAVSARGRFTFVLTGGDSPVPLYQLLAAGAAYRDFPWKQTICLFGDERHVPPDNPDSNYHQASRTLFHTGRVPAENIFRFRGEMPDPEEAAADYEKTLLGLFPENERRNGFPRFDALLLGLGANGHTASLFPCTKALHEKSRWAVANKVPRAGKTPPDDDFSPAQRVPGNLSAVDRSEAQRNRCERLSGGRKGFPSFPCAKNRSGLRKLSLVSHPRDRTSVPPQQALI